MFAFLGCEGEESPDLNCEGGACDTVESVGLWAIDMRKVNKVSRYSTSKRFVAADTTAELQLDQSNTGDAWPLVCAPEIIVGEGGSMNPGSCYSWGNMQRLNYNHSVHIDAAMDPSGQTSPLVNIIDQSGNHLDPPGYLNIIPMFNTCQEDQTAILDTLENGDILVYFHPEDGDTTQFRAHHAAMYYEIGGDGDGLPFSPDGMIYAHHIDNPESYGPAFTGGAASVPFHVFRFNPNLDDAIPDGPYARQAVNWALLTNDHAPFASFHYMSWPDQMQRGDMSVQDAVDQFAEPTLSGGKTPKVYCAGLVFTNLNLALNRPMNSGGLGADLNALFSGGRDASSFDFDDSYFTATLSQSQLQQGMENLTPVDRLLFEPVAASDILDGWLEGYIYSPRDPATGQPIAQYEDGLRRIRAALLAMAAPKLAGGFRSLVWAATKDEEAREEAPIVATPERIVAYALAYASPPGSDQHTVCLGELDDGCAAAMTGCVTGQADCAAVHSCARCADGGNDLVVLPGVPDGSPDLAQVKDLELRYVQNRYVPPPLYHVIANRVQYRDQTSLISYVGTVIPVDLLTPIDPAAQWNELDIDSLGIPSGGCNRFREGGPESSLYTHYAVPPGLGGESGEVGRHVQRIIEVSSGPNSVGPGSEVITRISAADIRDIRVLLHPPGSFVDEHSDAYACECSSYPALSVESAPRCEGQTTDCIHNAQGSFADGILLPLDSSTEPSPAEDFSISWDLFSDVVGCQITSDGRRMCPMYDWGADVASTEAMIDIGNAHGEWTLSVHDLGNYQDGVDVPNCAECSNGGAHSNQWMLIIKDEGSSEQ